MAAITRTFAVVAAVLLSCSALASAASVCPAVNNWSRYQNVDYTTPPAGCQDLSAFTSCFCNSTSWFVGRWYVSYPLTATNTYYGTYNGSVAKPWIEGVYSRSQCCARCQSYNTNTNKTDYCQYWQHMLTPSTQSCTGGSTSTCGICILYPPTVSPKCASDTCASSPFNGGLSSNMSTVGKKCAGCKNDPHFVGAHGTKFDFNGMPDQSFCLITDPKFQINMKMRGYYDERTVGASLIRNGMAVRTWIKELGVLWVDPATGKRHAFKMVARDGKSMERDGGYVGGMEFDGEYIPRMAPGDVAARDGGFSLGFTGYDKEGGGFFDVDEYQLQVAGLFTIEIRLRPAHPLLQTEEDAMTHINLKFLQVHHSESTHGVLGQTFRSGREKRAMDYSALSHLMGRDVAVDSEAGQGFLDGKTPDYRTTDVLSSDCRYSAFDGQELPALS